jgi:hypothetical protein
MHTDLTGIALRRLGLLAGALLALSVPAWADTSSTTRTQLSLPEAAPPPFQRYSITVGALYTHRQGETSGWLPNVEVNYAATENLQLHAMVPLAYDRLSGGSTNFGIGDFEIGARYRFIQPDDQGLRPAVSFYPLIDFPTGDEERNLGTGRTHVFLPLWVAKTFGAWTPYGGGGYWINPGPTNKDWWFFDGGLQYAVSDSLSVYGEIFHATSSKTTLPETTGFNIGGTYNLTASHHILVSVGRAIQNARETNQFTGYLAYMLTF